MRWFHRIPTNQTNWTNFPSEENSYITSAYWHRAAPLWITSLKPAGDQAPRHRRLVEATMPPPRTSVRGGGCVSRSQRAIAALKARVIPPDEQMPHCFAATVARHRLLVASIGHLGLRSLPIHRLSARAAGTRQAVRHVCVADRCPVGSRCEATDRIITALRAGRSGGSFGSGLRPPLRMTSYVGGGNRSSGPRLARASFASGASRSGGYTTLPYGTGSAQAFQVDRRC